MRKFETIGIVDEQGNLTISVPTNIPPGEYHVVVVIDAPEEQPEEESERLITWPPPGFNLFNATLTDPENTLRRKNMYDTDRG